MRRILPVPLSLFLAVALGLCALALAPGAARADTPPPEAAQDAAKALPDLLQAIPGELLAGYGFEDPAQFASATLGEPYQVRMILPDALLKATADTPILSLATDSPLWFFPVVVDGTSRVFVKVSLRDGAWKAFGIGMSPLARQADAAKADFPAAQGYSHALVVSYQAGPAYFIVASRGQEAGIVPLGAGKTLAGTARAEAASADARQAFLKRLQDAVRKNMQTPQGGI
uniref:Uncharacterized protein n=1 Tax=Fundidesulfovibrio putealis TaxID=270496 RepID=A0A7C4ELT4_9BACT